MRPLILCTCSREDVGKGQGIRRYLSENYLDALIKTGGNPVLFGGGKPEEHMRQMAGLLLSGGGDVAPSLFGEPVLFPQYQNVDSQRDMEELALVRAFLAAQKPIFGICRGIQVLNIALGGTLWQHLPAQIGRDHSSGVHTISFVANSRLRRLLGPARTVNSYHHQAVHTVGSGLIATAFCEDLIEGIEHESLPVFGVQWHPERMEEMLPLFQEFTALCSEGLEGESI